MRIKIVKHPECGASTAHIESVSVVKETPEIVLIDINLRTKNKSVDAYGGSSDPDAFSVWVGYEEVQFSGLPDPPAGKFWHGFAETSRYTAMLCLYCCEISERSKCVWNKVEH